MLVRPNPQAEVIERDLLSAHHAQITKVEQWCFEIALHSIQSVDEG